MKKTILILFSIVTTFHLLAQETQSSAGTGSTNSLSNSYSWATTAQMNELRSIVDKQSLSREESYSNIAGSPFLTDKKVRGFITMNDGKIVQNVPMQFDLYAQTILVKNKQGEEIALDNRFYKEIKMKVDNQTLLFKKVNLKAQDQFYQILFEGEGFKFVKEVTAILKEGRSQGVASIEPEFFKKTNYYISLKDGTFIKVSLKKNKREEFFAALSEQQGNALRSSVKTDKIKLKKEEDFINLFQQVLNKK